MKTRDLEQDDQYQDKLAKILPAELTATYFLIRAFAGSDANLTSYLLLVGIVLCFAFYLIAPKLINLQNQRNRILYCVTFLFWMFAMDPYRFAIDSFGLSDEHAQTFVFLASAFAAVWSFAVAPFLQPKET